MFKALMGIALVTCLLSGCSGATPPTPPLTPVTVYEGNANYEAFTEPESPWYGTLNKTAEGSYALVYRDAEQALYTEDAEDKIERFINHKVIVTGKLAGAGEGALLWPAAVKVHTDGLLACSKLIPPVPLEEKLTQQYLKDLLAEQPGERVEPISISFCDDQTITPGLSGEELYEQLVKLRASAFALLSEELAPYIVSVQDTSWLTGGIYVDMPLEQVREVAKRADIINMSALNAPQPPPP